MEEQALMLKPLMRAKMEYCYQGTESLIYGSEIGTLVVKASAKLTVPHDRYEQIQVGSRSVTLHSVSNLKLNKIHLTAISLKMWDNTSSMYSEVYERS